MKDKNGNYINEPIGEFNHGIDATLYVVMTEILGGEKKPVNLSRLGKSAF
ncbi:MAG: hypothetical protein LBP25_05180 [Tannerellaceae bacterium]|jgi:hypothetical protein|nr:hypothetical protein [Tannerellaceae bacterium]